MVRGSRAGGSLHGAHRVQSRDACGHRPEKMAETLGRAPPSAPVSLSAPRRKAAVRRSWTTRP